MSSGAEFTLSDVLATMDSPEESPGGIVPSRRRWGRTKPAFICGRYMKKQFRKRRLIMHGESKAPVDVIWLRGMNRLDGRIRDRLRSATRALSAGIERLKDEMEDARKRKSQLDKVLETVIPCRGETYDSGGESDREA